MKRIEVHTKIENLTPILEALKKIGVSGVTVAQVRGRGSVEPPMISGLRGTVKYAADFNTRNLIYTIVEDSKSEEVIQAILKSVHSDGEKVFGKIFVTPIEDAIDLGTGLRGSEALKSKSA
ncbi:MAG TPA: P-II family nitrogen regulator [Nitrosopumilaceae archaeon]|nr:P-II family nitrogen regulator [Nitrosopumilaceae archaeon]